MKQETFQENKMGTMPIGKLLFTMSAPMMASMLFQALYNVVDSVFVARLSQDAMNAVSLAFPMQTLAMAFAIGTGVGINALLSRSLGEKNQGATDRAANTGIFLYICTSIVFMIIGFTFPETFYRLLTDNSQIIDYGKSYLTVCLGFSFCLFAQVCSERLLQSTGRTDLAMIPQITGAVFNMIMDPIMIFGLLGFPRLEVLGAAVATVCGQFVAAIVGFILNVKKNKEIQLSFEMICHPHGATIREIYHIGIPSIIMQAIGSVMTFSLNSILIKFTEAATAVFGAYFKIQSFVFLPVFGMNSAVVPIISYNYGARQPDRVKKATRLSIIAAVCIMIIGTLCFELMPGLLIKIFSPSEEMLSVGKTAFRIIAVHFPVAGFCIVASSVCQALRKPVYALITSVFRQLVVLIPAAYLLSLTGRLELVWLAFPVAEIISGILSAIFLAKTFRTTSMESIE
ncbi:MAG: MATE family efflux transporter [Eubacteriales bacterium]|nr:MATE family efflux transporter [Eubacteriales bacterium]